MKVRDVAVHGKDTVGNDEFGLRPRGVRLFEFGFQVGHVGVGVAKPFRFGQANAVDDAGVVELIADDGVFGAKNGFEQTAVGVKGREVKDGVLGTQELG